MMSSRLIEPLPTAIRAPAAARRASLGGRARQILPQQVPGVARRGWALVRESPYTETHQAAAAPRRCCLSTTAHSLPAPLPQASLHPDRQKPPTTPELHFSNASSAEVPKSLLPRCHPASVPTPRPCTNGGGRPSRCIKARRAPRPQPVWCRKGCEPGVPDVPGWLDVAVSARELWKGKVLRSAGGANCTSESDAPQFRGPEFGPRGGLMGWTRAE